VKLTRFLSGAVSGEQRMIGSFTDFPEVLEFINAHSATGDRSCPGSLSHNYH
jgi:hypothetical protein